MTLCVVVSCFRSEPSELAGKGGGAETTDGQVIASTGMAQGVRVRLVPESFNPLVQENFPESLTAFTDASGRYAFKGIAAGRYNLEGFQPRDGTRLFRSGMEIERGVSRTLPAATLARPCRLSLVWEGSHRGYLFMRGTSMLRRIVPAEIEAPVVELDSLPMGRLPPLYWSQSKTDTIGIRITDSVTLSPDSAKAWTVFAAWPHHGTWHINTTSTGAGISDTLVSFPMLVRLTSAGFDFTQADADGRDIRFSDPDGSELNYQVERWDARAGLAEVWVRVPRVNGGQDGDSFRMHWGAAGVDSHSSGSGVFGPHNSFAAVLHLHEAGNTINGGYSDATGSGRAGTGLALDGNPAVEGVIATSQNLDGSNQWITVAGNLPAGNTARSLSAWGKTNNPFASSQLAAYGSAGDLASFGEWNNAGTWMAWCWGNSNDIETSAKVDTGWHQITFDYDGIACRFYVDGILVGNDDKNLATTAYGFTIGNSYAGDRPWPGLVDEVEVSTVSRSADWIRLSFANQRQGSNIPRLEIRK